MGSPGQSYGVSPAIWDHTPVNVPCLNSSQIGWYLIYSPWRDGRLNWPRQPITYRDGLPACRQSPIAVVTRPGVE